MYRIHHRLAFAAIVLVLSGLSHGDWPAFHGGERQGRCDSDAGPLHWSSSQNVVWKTVIPGRGHSSPILSGDAVYVTTTYELHRSAVSASVWRYAVSALALLFAVMGARAAMTSLDGGRTTLAMAGQYARFFLFVQILVGTAIVALFGRHLLNPDDDPTRHWLISIAMMLSCVAAGSLLVPLRSRQHLAAGALCLLLPVPTWIVFRHTGFALDLGSAKGLIAAALAASPIVLGIALCVGHLWSRRRLASMARGPRDDESPRRPLRHLVPLAVAGFIAALAPFILLLYRAAEYRMPDSYVLSMRVRPDMGWWAIAVYVAVAGAAIVGLAWNARRTGATDRFPWQQLFFVVALSLGATYSSRIIHIGKPKEFVRALVCLDAGTGKVSWIREGLTAGPRGQSRVVTHASPTPVTDGRRIYAYFGEDGLICVDPNGEILWKREEPMFRCKFGAGTSPVVKDDILVIVSDVKVSNDRSSSITALEGSSGRPVWHKTRKSHEAYATYSTPLIKPLNGRDTVIVHGWDDVKGYDLKTGEELWSYGMDHAGKHLVASMVHDEDRLYVVVAERAVALSLSGLAAGGEPLVWSRPIPGEKSSTPVLVNGLLFLITEPGMAHCLESDTGRIVWKERLKGRYFSSVVSAANRVFFTNEAGQTTVVAAGREFEVLAKNSLGESVYASFAPADDRLFVRTGEHLYCIREPKR